jgi:hypothetical protein
MRMASGLIGNRAGWMAALVAIGCFLFVASPAAEAGKGGKDKEHKIHGKVTKVEADSASSGVTWITVEIHHHHKKGAPDAGAQVSEVRKFKLTSTTTFVEKVSKSETKPATLQDVTVGTHVALKAHDDMVDTLAIHHHHKKKVA